MTRVYESVAVCALMIVVIFCLANLISILLDEGKTRYMALFSKILDTFHFIRRFSILFFFSRNLELPIAVCIFMCVAVWCIYAVK